MNAGNTKLLNQLHLLVVISRQRVVVIVVAMNNETNLTMLSELIVFHDLVAKTCRENTITIL